MAPLRLTRAWVLLLAAASLAPVGAAAQAGGAGSDTVPPPSRPGAVSDTVPAGDTAAAQPLLDRPRFDAGRSASRVLSWDRDQLLESTALSVQDFLLDAAPGVLPLRAGFYFGPHQLADGPWGGAAVRVRVDGRELPPLASGQADLSRISLARVRRIRLIRRAGGTVVEVQSLRHEGAEAYSRISALTGQPGADGIRAIFTNGAGENLTVHAALDHLNVGGGVMPGSRFDMWAKVGWRSDGGETGLDLVWDSESVDRTLAEQTSGFSRGQVLLHGRTSVGPGLQAEAWAGRTSRDPRPDFSLADDGPVGSGVADEAPGPYEVEQLLASVTYAGDGALLRASAGRLEGAGVPDLTGDVRSSFQLGPLTAEAGVEAASWEEFSTLSWSAGLVYRPEWLGGAAARLEAGAGERAVARPGRSVTDSLVQDFDAVSAGTELELGSYRLEGSVARRTLSTQLPFGGFFDRDLPAGGEASLTDFEVRAEGPPLPFGALEDRVLARGFWRYTPPGEDGSLPYYVPEVLARGEGWIRDTFFEDNLEVRLTGRFAHRGSMVSARPGRGEPVVLPAETSFGSELVIRIGSFRLWWRRDNFRGVEQQDFDGLLFPRVRNVYGIRWEFVD